MQAAQGKNIPVVGDIELFAWNVRARASEKVLAVTGTNGKSTVTALTGHLLRAAGVDCEVAGNIGPPALDALMKRGKKHPAVWVLELSSYQLETTWSLEPEAAAMLNLSEDHLERYAGLAEYAEAKARVFPGCRRAGPQPLRLGFDGAGVAGTHAADLRTRCTRDAGRFRRRRRMAGARQGTHLRRRRSAARGRAQRLQRACGLRACLPRRRSARRARAGPAQLPRPCRTACSASRCAAGSNGSTIPRAPTSAPQWPRSKGSRKKRC